MICDICNKKKATVHLTEIVDDQMTEMHLCEECAREKSVQMEQQFGLADLLAGLADFGKQVKDLEKVKMECSSCGMNYDEFRKFGRLGCSNCYPAFKQHLGSLLKKIHGSSRHVGKMPVKFWKEGKKKGTDTLQQLRHELESAIENEDFEKAAALRDKIREFENNQGA
jgi:protein arginine kinase activator